MKGIIFNTEMVRAIMDGRKTQTRRPVKLKKGWRLSFEGPRKDLDSFGVLDSFGNYILNRDESPATLKECDLSPYKIGDKLYVRETFAENPNQKGDYEYRASVPPAFMSDWRGKWKPSIHMPKEAARLFLEVTDVRVERLQDICEADAIKEGVQPVNNLTLDQRVHNYNNPSAAFPWSHREGFIKLWDSIDYKRPLESNPWVWVIEFKKL